MLEAHSNHRRGAPNGDGPANPLLEGVPKDDAANPKPPPDGDPKGVELDASAPKLEFPPKVADDEPNEVLPPRVEVCPKPPLACPNGLLPPNADGCPKPPEDPKPPVVPAPGEAPKVLVAGSVGSPKTDGSN